MSLFISNISNEIIVDEFNLLFSEYGGCEIVLKKGYAIVHYDNPSSAELALF
jgi:hypothetical protein